MMDRRAFLVMIGGSVLIAPLAGEGQAPQKEPRVGYLSIGLAADPRRVAIFDAFRRGLHDLGYIENRNISIETRFADGDYDRLPGLAPELIRLRVDIIMANSTPAVKAALGATRTIPIVMSAVVDPVATGLVISLGRPGGNVTGMSLMAPEIIGKQMQLLKELAPKVSRVAVLWNPANPSGASQRREAEVAARTLRVQLQPLGARDSSELDRPATEARHAVAARSLAEGVLVRGDPRPPPEADRRSRVAVFRGYIPRLRAHPEVPQPGPPVRGRWGERGAGLLAGQRHRRIDGRGSVGRNLLAHDA